MCCTDSLLEVLPLTLNLSIQRLHLQQNKIKAVDAVLGFYAQLQIFDLSSNQMSIQSTEEADGASFGKQSSVEQQQDLRVIKFNS